MGVDEKGFTGKIKIVDDVNDFHYRRKFNNVTSKSMASVSTNIQTTPLSGKAQAKIATRVLSENTKFNINLLHNNSISVLDKEGDQSYNDPVDCNRIRTNDTDFGDKINVTAVHGEINKLGTVEAIQSYLGLHELNGHGVNDYSGGKSPGGNHYQAYMDQFNDKDTYNKLSEAQQMEVAYRTVSYMAVENGNLYDRHAKGNTPLYKKYRNAYYYYHPKK